jgi:hypothetical protein
MSDKYLMDNHTLHITCDGANATQIYTAFNTAIRTYQTTTGKPLECRYRVNMIADKEGRSLGFAFVFVSNPEVYHMLLGHNPDGTERMEYIEDPNWRKPCGEEIVNDAGWATVEMDFDSPISWSSSSEIDWSAETAKSDEAMRRQQELESKMACPKISIPLPPLMVLPPYQLTADQVAEKHRKILEENQNKPDFDPSMVEVSNTVNFKVQWALVQCLDSKFMHNILKAKNIPEWVSERDLKVLFSPFASNTSIKQRFVKGRKVEECYPFVSIDPERRVAFIVFDPSTTNAQFALHMMKKTLVRRKSPEEEVMLFFSHSFRSDRDAMALVSQQPKPVTQPPKKPVSQPPKKPAAPRAVRAPSAPIQQKAPPKSATNLFSYLTGDD